LIRDNAARRKALLGLSIGLLGLAVFSLLWGRYPVFGVMSPLQLQEDGLARLLVFNLRLPRLLMALLLGAALAGAGVVFQTVFSNPLVEPGFLGISQGAAFGAALAIVTLNAATLMVQGMAALFALAGLGFSYFLARRIRYGGWVLRLVLAGIAVSALYSAGLGILKYVADPLKQLPEITFWLLGGLASVTWRQLLSVLPVVLTGLLVLWLMRWRLNLLALNEETAFAMGASPRRERWLLLVAAVLPVAAVVSVAGMVGWVGLIVPHMVRRIFGADTQYTLPAAMLLGGGFTLVCDDLARSLLTGEIPLGILTSLLGATIFMGMMMSRGIRIER
jgi:iron complex transport system permease protein